MIFMTLNFSDLKPNSSTWSAEERGALEKYNKWFSWGGAYEYGKNIHQALDALLILFPEHPALLLRRVEMLKMGLTSHYKAPHDAELLRALNSLLSSEVFLSYSTPEMRDEQIRMRVLRRDVYLRQQAFDLALPDLAYLIEQTYESRAHSSYYSSLDARSKIFKTQGKLEQELDDLNALLTPPHQVHLSHASYGNVHSYSRRGLYRRSEIFVTQDNYEGALRDLDALLSQEPWDAPALMLRYQVFQALNQQEHAFKDEVVLHDCLLSSPVYQKQGETRPLMFVPDELKALEDFGVDGGQIERVIPSLQVFAKMTFFKHEANMDTSEWVASNPTGVRTSFKEAGITPEAINHMRTQLSHEDHTCAGKTVFEALETCELAAEDWDVGVSNIDNKKRKHDAISPSMS
ncbi:MAG: hypothetical protein P1U36_08130 [Legionellaceae bacterium]|nr:hypothetical protein [Legionellaceae bacterium]